MSTSASEKEKAVEKKEIYSYDAPWPIYGECDSAGSRA